LPLEAELEGPEPTMMQLQKISEETTISDAASVEGALSKLRMVPEHELQYYLALRDTLQTTSAATRQAITLAQLESDRRSNNRNRWLAITTTCISGIVGLLGVILGAYLSK
jgi:hypothetical protein